MSVDQFDQEATEILQAALERIRDPEHWCQCAFALNAQGDKVGAYDSDAVQWCARGALIGLAKEDPKVHKAWMGASERLNAACSDLFGSYPAEVNDGQGHAAVMQMYEKAINS